MAIRTVITLTHGTESIQTIKDRLLKPQSKVQEQLNALRGFFHAAAGRDRNVKVVTQVDSGNAVQASGTVTLASMVAADTVTIGGVVFTAIASGATGNQFNVGGTDTITAANLASVINANASLAQTLSASSAGAVVTISCKVPGKIGNYIGLAISAHGSVSAATLASGADATTYSSKNTYSAGV